MTKHKQFGEIVNAASDQTPYYEMFTDLGNAAVHAIVVTAQANDLTWAETYRALHALSEQEGFGEATDTAVREAVYYALGFDSKS